MKQSIVVLLFYIITTPLAFAQGESQPKKELTKYKSQHEVLMTTHFLVESEGNKDLFSGKSYFKYQNERQGETLKVIHLATKIQAVENGIEDMNSEMSLKKYRTKRNGRWIEVPFKEANPALKKVLTDLFSGSLATIKVDAEGKELSRKVHKKAKDGKPEGVIHNLRLCHPHFPATKKWTAKRTYNAGALGPVSGVLSYEKLGKKDPKGYTLVKVTGVLTKTITTRGSLVAKYVCSGQQRYDEARRIWIGAELKVKINMSIRTSSGKQSTTTGVITLQQKLLKSDLPKTVKK